MSFEKYKYLHLPHLTIIVISIILLLGCATLKRTEVRRTNSRLSKMPYTIVIGGFVDEAVYEISRRRRVSIPLISVSQMQSSFARTFGETRLFKGVYQVRSEDGEKEELSASLIKAQEFGGDYLISAKFKKFEYKSLGVNPNFGPVLTADILTGGIFVPIGFLFPIVTDQVRLTMEINVTDPNTQRTIYLGLYTETATRPTSLYGSGDNLDEIGAIALKNIELKVLDDLPEILENFPKVEVVREEAIVVEKKEVVKLPQPPEHRPKIAVLTLNETNEAAQEEGYGEIISAFLTTALVNTNGFEVIERTQLKALLEEQKLNVSGFVDKETAVKIGGVLGVESLILGNVAQLGNVIEVDVRIVTTERGEAIIAESGSSVGAPNIRRMVNQIADKIAQKYHQR